jgi:DNA gyrase/topoisomerase IV subunit B
MGMGYKEIERVTRIHNKTLTKVLKSLQREGIVEKEQTSQLENMSYREVMKAILKIHLKKDDFKRVKIKKSKNMLTTKNVNRIYFDQNPDFLTETPKNLMKWDKGFHKYAKTPKPIINLLKKLKKQKTVYRIRKPKAVLIG